MLDSQKLNSTEVFNGQFVSIICLTKRKVCLTLMPYRSSYLESTFRFKRQEIVIRKEALQHSNIV